MLRNVVAETMSVSRVTRSSGSDVKGADLLLQKEDDSASYLFELLIAARRLAVTRRYRFLAYLIGMAAEEARLVSQGRSAVGQ